MAVMRAAAEVSTPASLERRWGSVLADMPQSLALWREYLAFKRGRFGDFDIHALRWGGGWVIGCGGDLLHKLRVHVGWGVCARCKYLCRDACRSSPFPATLTPHPTPPLLPTHPTPTTLAGTSIARPSPP